MQRSAATGDVAAKTSKRPGHHGREPGTRRWGVKGEARVRSITLAAAAAALLAISGSAIATPSDAGRTVFEVTRNGAPFGTHTISVSESGDTLRAQSRIDMRANAGPITMFRLEQTCAETWSGGSLAALSCTTLRDGRRSQVRGERQDNRLRVVGTSGENWFPIGAFPSTWWTAPPTSATSFIDTATGAPLRARVTLIGRESFEVGGQHIQADHYRIAGALTADLWYDANGRWVGCSFVARGQRIEYRLASPLSGAPA